MTDIILQPDSKSTCFGFTVVYQLHSATHFVHCVHCVDVHRLDCSMFLTLLVLTGVPRSPRVCGLSVDRSASITLGSHDSDANCILMGVS